MNEASYTTRVTERRFIAQMLNIPLIEAQIWKKEPYQLVKQRKAKKEYCFYDVKIQEPDNKVQNAIIATSGLKTTKGQMLPFY